jgi:hypothetical protein
VINGGIFQKGSVNCSNRNDHKSLGDYILKRKLGNMYQGNGSPTFMSCR